MRKILAIVLICTVSSFAVWNYFPVIEEGKGEAKVGFIHYRQGNEITGGGLDYFRMRYSPIANLELLSQWGYTFGARYQIMPVLSGGVEIGFPIPSTAWSFTPNVQFSIPLTSALELGSNAQVTIYTEDHEKYTNGMDFSAGVELDLAIGQSIIWVGCDINTGLTKSKTGSYEIEKKNESRGLEIVPMIGAFVVNSSILSLGTNVGMAFGEDAGHDKFGTFVGLDFAVKF